MLEQRYSRNKKMISDMDQQLLREAHVCVLGCGGLGGYIIEMLTRIGIGHITAVDGDCFDESNLNRQLLSDMSTLGKSKANVAAERIHRIDPETSVRFIDAFLTEENAVDILQEHTVVIDALDSIEARFMVSKYCTELDIPYICGAIAGWYGQVTTIFPGDNTLHKLYKGTTNKGMEKELGNPSFTPALVASIEVSECIKLITKKGTLLRHKFMYINLLDQEFEVFDLR